MATIFKPPAPLPDQFEPTPKLFLAGSIEMGKAVDWQAQVTTALAHKRLHILNPRRDAWDSSWEQRSGNPAFHEQVTWELDGLGMCDVAFFYFEPATMAPVTLLELGLFGPPDYLIGPKTKAVVCCPDGYWRKGNVEIVCQRYEIPLFNVLEEALTHLSSLFDDEAQPVHS